MSLKKLVFPAAGACLLFLAGSMTGCRNKETEEIHAFSLWELTEESFCTFQDGTTVQEWENEAREKRYQLEDGTELLHFKNSEVLTLADEIGGIAGISAMSPEAQKKVEEYYESEQKEFRIRPYLESAYSDYCECIESEERFTAHEVLREVSPVAQADGYGSFLTVLIVPKKEHFEGDTVCRYENCLFDSVSGEQLDVWSLFSETKEEAWTELAMLCAVEDSTISEEDILEASAKADILVFQDYLEVWFPYGTWERQEFDKGFGLKYELMEGILNDTAVPKESD